jgi:DNA-binding response OmpR family regulator
MTKPTILVVDDDETICITLKYELEKNGFEVETVEDAEGGIRQMTAKDYDLVILDLNLGEMTGVDVLKSVNLKNKNTKILIHSGYGKRFCLHEQAMELGGHDSLQKPCTPEALLTKISSLIEMVRV